MICVIAIFLLHCQPLCFFGLAVAEAGEVRLPPRAHSRVLGYLSVGQSVVSVFTELAARVPRKMLVFDGIVINFAKKKKKKSLTPTPPASPPTPLRRVKKEPHPQPLSEWRGE